MREGQNPSMGLKGSEAQGRVLVLFHMDPGTLNGNAQVV